MRPKTDGDSAWADALVQERWGGPLMVSRGAVHDLRALPGLIVERGTARSGLLTYRPDARGWEVVSLDAVPPHHGLGTALIEAVTARARAAGCLRVWLVTTNDNLDALRFYQRRGFAIAAVHCRAVEDARRIKPTIPSVGSYGIPIRDEIELERTL